MDQPLRRRQRLLRRLKELELDALFITNPLNVGYLTGFGGESSYLILTAKHSILVSDTRFSIQIADECPGLETNIRSHNKTTLQAAIETLTQLHVSTVGVESRHLTLELFEKLREALPSVVWVRTLNLVEELRAIKDAGEIAAIRKSVKIAEQAFVMLRAMLQPTDTEKELVLPRSLHAQPVGGA